MISEIGSIADRSRRESAREQTSAHGTPSPVGVGRALDAGGAAKRPHGAARLSVWSNQNRSPNPKVGTTCRPSNAIDVMGVRRAVGSRSRGAPRAVRQNDTSPMAEA